MTILTATPTATPSSSRSEIAAKKAAGRGNFAAAAAVPVLALAALMWACWPTLTGFVHLWSTNPQYSHGFLVIPFAAFLLWHRRDRFTPDRRERPWAGALLLAIGASLKLVAGFFAFAWPDQISVLFLTAGIFGVLGGWPALRWAWPALAFLAFMVPLYGRVEMLLSGPLQRVATLVSANVLQTLGFFAQADGNVIILSEADLGIVEACSGLRMLLAFAAMTTGVAIVIDRPLWQRWALLGGIVPIALACNIGRIVVTAIVLETLGKKWADLVFHDLAGWLMMPAGLALLAVELALLNRLFVPAVTPASVPLGATTSSSNSALPKK